MSYLRTKPSFGYSGLTVVLSNPSRLDKARLLTGDAARVLNEFCLKPELNTFTCDVRVAEDDSPFLPNTKCILALGEFAMHRLVHGTMNNTLHEMRGSLFYNSQNIPVIPSYYPQDCADIKNYERENNPLSKDYTPDSEDDEGEESSEAQKRYSKTHRRNYAFWLRSDVRKAKWILKNGNPVREKEPNYVSCPTFDLLLNVLTSNKQKFLYFDIETDWEEQNIQCFSFSFDGQNVYNVPLLDYNYRPYYNRWWLIMRALAVAFRDNVVVAHNGALFDYFVLMHKYRIPLYRVYDTMVAMHRCFPDVEKSLGHCVSYWTWQNFHKDEDAQGYRSDRQMHDRLKYCGKDVFTMFLVHKAIEKYSATVPGLQHSIDSVQECIIPYLTTTLQGLRCNEEKRAAIVAENDRLMMQYMRICDILIGELGKKMIKDRMKGKPKGFPNSSAQCCIYFHDILGYPIVARSKKTNKPSLGKKAIFTLALRHDNPLLRVVVAYRILSKESGSLKFNKWQGNRNTCFYTSCKVKTFRQSSIGIFKDLTDR